MENSDCKMVLLSVSNHKLRYDRQSLMQLGHRLR